MRAQQIKTLTLNTIQREYRSKALLSIFVMTIILIVLVDSTLNFFMEATKGSFELLAPSLKKMNIFYRMINIWSGVMATFFGVHAIKSDYDFSIITQLLAFPIKKIDYLISRLLGTWAIVVGYYFISIILGSVLFYFSSGEFGISFALITSFLINSVSMLVLITIGAIFSLFFQKTFAFIGVLFTSVVISVSNAKLDSISLADTFSDMSLGKGFFMFFHYLFPRIGTIDSISTSIFTGESSNLNFGIEGLHFILAYSLFFYLLYFIMKRKGI